MACRSRHPDASLEHLTKALSLTIQLNSDEARGNVLQAIGILLFQSERLYFSDDVSGAMTMADEARNAASHSADPELRLQADLNAAVVSAHTKPSRSAAARMEAIARDATRQTLRALALTADIERASTLLKVGGDREPQLEVDRMLAAAETLGNRMLLARAHFIRGEVRRRSGSAASQRDYETALRLLRETAAESGGENLLRRADIAELSRECERWSKQ